MELDLALLCVEERGEKHGVERGSQSVGVGVLGDDEYLRNLCFISSAAF